MLLDKAITFDDWHVKSKEPLECCVGGRSFSGISEAGNVNTKKNLKGNLQSWTPQIAEQIS